MDGGPERWEESELPNRGRLWSKVLWLAILVVAAGIFMMQLASADALVGNPTPQPQNVPSMELRYATRVNFGAEKLENALNLPSGTVASSDMTRMLQDYATGPIELLRAAIAAAAIGDRDLATRLHAEALSELEKLERELEPVDDAEQRAEREVWFEEMRRDIDQVGIAVSSMDGASLSADERDRLVDRHGDFGEMIPVIGAPDSSPIRDRFESRGLRTLIAVIVVASIGGIASLAGFGLFVLAIVLLATRRVRRRLNIQSQWSHRDRTLLLEAFALFLVSFVLVSELGGVLSQRAGLDLSSYLIWLLLLTPFWPLLRGMSWSQLHLALGWHANGEGKKGALKEAGLGIVAYLAGLPIVFGFAMISAILVFFTQSEPSHPAATEATNADLWTAIKLFVLASLWAPIVEETVFRGLLYYNMRKWLSPVISALAVAFIFAIIHPQGLALVPALMGLAVVFALIREWRGSIIGPMVAHGVHNAFVISLIIFVLGS